MNLYIDPGTGSMLFTILIGVLGALVYAFRNVLMKAKFAFSGGKAAKEAAAENRNSIVIFTDSKRYWNLFRPICDELEKRQQKALYLTASEDDPALEAGYRYVRTEFAGKGNRAYARMNMICADVVLSSTPGLDVYQWKRSRDVKWYVHIPHGIYDLTAYRMFGLDYYDAVLLVGSFQKETVRKLEEERNLPEKELTVVGMPYMDEMLKRKEEEEAGKTADQAEGAGTKTVLLASSWGASSLLNRYQGKLIDALLQTDVHIIVRPHPQSYTSEKDLIERLMKEYPESDRLEWDRNDDNYESLKRADLLISDFSGVIIDYAFVFEKPVIYADISFDREPYDASWIETPMWRFEVLKDIGIQLTEENADRIGELIDICLNSPELKAGIRKAREEAWAHIGESASLTVDYLLEKAAVQS
ncbi:MAG: CDP-glycerol glycerophosphotransferase family protein [Clostridiales bacterium]|nr:CDP-glycerol glycerophosphotransferase family protein [Clostridiales bacterium]